MTHPATHSLSRYVSSKASCDDLHEVKSRVAVVENAPGILDRQDSGYESGTPDTPIINRDVKVCELENSIYRSLTLSDVSSNDLDAVSETGSEPDVSCFGKGVDPVDDLELKLKETGVRIKPEIEKNIPESALSVLKTKVAYDGYRNPYFIEATPLAEEQACVQEQSGALVEEKDKVTNQSGVFSEKKEGVDNQSMSLVDEKDEVKKQVKLLAKESEDVQNRSVPRVSLKKKESVERLIGELVDRTKELLPDNKQGNYLKHYLTINISPVLKQFSAIGEIADCENLASALYSFCGQAEKALERLEHTLSNNQEPLSEMSPDEQKRLQQSIKLLDNRNALLTVYDGLAHLVEDELNRQIAAECKVKLKQAFSSYQNPSEESFVRGRVQLGVGVDVGSVDGGFEISSQIVGCDDTKIRTFTNKKFTLRLVAGTDFLKGYVAGVKGQIDGKVFNNIDEFIDYYADNMLLALHNPMPGKHVNRSVVRNKLINAHKRRIVRNMPALEQSLKRLEVPMMASVGLKYDTYSDYSPLKIKRSVTEGHMGVRALKMFGVDRTSTQWKNQFTKKIALIEQLKKNPEWIRTYDKHYFNVSIPPESNDYLNKLKMYDSENIQLHASDLVDKTQSVYRGGEVIPAIARRLLVLEGVVRDAQIRAKEDKNVRLGYAPVELRQMGVLLKNLIQQNYEEYKEYCRYVNVHANNPANKRADALKASMKRIRSATTTPEMLKMMMVTHVRLLNLLERTRAVLGDSVSESTREWLEQIELDLSGPDVNISRKDRDQYLMLDSKAKGSIQFNDTIIKAAVGPFQGLFDIRFIKNQDEPNPDSDGEYLYVAVRLSGLLTASLAENSVASALQSLLGTLPPVDGEAPILIDPLSVTDLVLQGHRHYKMELFYVKGADDTYHLQYKRRLAGEEAAAKVGVKAPVFAGLNSSVQAAADRYDYHFMGEDIGTDTMTYVMTRHNGWMAGGKQERWKAFLTNPDCQTSLAGLMVNMASEGKNAALEFQDTLQNIRAYYSDKATSGQTKEERETAQKILEQSEEWPQAFEKLRIFHDMCRASHLTDDNTTVVSRIRAKATEIIASLDEKTNQEKLSALRKIQTELAEMSPREALPDVDSNEVEQNSDASDSHRLLREDLEKLNREVANAIKDLGNPLSWFAGKSKKNVKKLLQRCHSVIGQVDVLYSETVRNSAEQQVLSMLVDNIAFDKAKAAFNNLLKANYPLYLDDMNQRFEGVAPNPPGY